MTADALPYIPSTEGVTDADKYFFDLNGFLLLREAIDPDHLALMNAQLDGIINLDPPLEHGQWYGGVHAHTFGKDNGVNLQQAYELGEPFERLIDHPAWIDKVRCFVGGHGTFDHHHGDLFIDESFVSLRGPGESIGMHSGGHEHTKRTQFQIHNGRFHCGQVNILMALTDIGPGDGATMVVPASHKANFAYPSEAKHAMGSEQNSLDGCIGAVEVHMNAGDALLFVDAISHGSAKRRNEGLRRIAVYRYGPSWGFFRHPYRPTPQLLERLTDVQRKIVMPHEAITRQPNRLPDFPDPPEAR